jgi:hypothetical protein
MHLEHVLGQIDANRGNLHVDGSLNVIRLRRSPYGTSMPGAGAVHHINNDRWSLAGRDQRHGSQRSP